MPIGGPEKIAPITGNVPRWSFIQGSTFTAMNGAKTNRPHMP